MCIGICKATKAKGVKMGGQLVFQLGTKSKYCVTYIDIGGEMKYECGVGESKAGAEEGESLVSFVYSYSGF